MMSMVLYSLIKCLTRITNISTSILDNFYTNFNTDNVSYGTINYEIKGHLTILLNIKLEKYINQYLKN